MTTLGTESELFKKFQDFRDRIMKAEAIVDITQIKSEMKPYIDAAPPVGFKLDLRKALESCLKIKEAELYGEAPPQTDMNTQNISAELMPSKGGGEEVDLSKIEPAPLTGRAKEISEEMKDIDAENFKADIVTPSGVGQEMKPVEDKGQAEVQKEVMATEVKKTRSRTKPTEETVIETVPRSQKSVKLFRRINVSINGIAYTNNEIGYEIIADTREEALAEAEALRASSLNDIRELNELMKVKPNPPATPAQPATPTQPATPAQPATPTPVTIKDANEVFPDANFDAEKVKKAVASKNPAGLNPGHEFDLYNLERLRALFTILRSVDEVAVQMPDGSGMMLGTYITQETQKFGATFPMAKAQ